MTEGSISGCSGMSREFTILAHGNLRIDIKELPSMILLTFSTASAGSSGRTAPMRASATPAIVPVNCLVAQLRQHHINQLAHLLLLLVKP
ncbi:hypothetical protein PCASD_10228 [Puccinia coronata f. sp. avenae]|uniref:Uncharacterized protein n=1 Tax=Puccinia coronata f. sp. avenae TaxID=200324 RepID=A0A2N5UD27_9BASI|nr:hypothetical protein PCASD_10228 [Puccinia coronata f. sp. avenae]